MSLTGKTIWKRLSLPISVCGFLLLGALSSAAHAAADSTVTPHLQFVGYWSPDVLTSDQLASLGGLFIAAGDSNMLPIGTFYDSPSAAELDQSFREYARDAISVNRWIFINLPLPPALTCPQFMGDDAFQAVVGSLFATTRAFLGGAYTNGRPLWDRVAMIQVADEPDTKCHSSSWRYRIEGLVQQAHEAFPGLRIMVNYVFAGARHVPPSLDVVGVDPYYCQTGSSFKAQVLPRLRRAKRTGKPIALIARSFAEIDKKFCRSGYPVLLTAQQESKYYALVQGEAQVIALLWGWVFRDWPKDQPPLAWSGVLHDDSIKALHQSIGQEILNTAPLPRS